MIFCVANSLGFHDVLNGFPENACFPIHVFSENHSNHWKYKYLSASKPLGIHVLSEEHWFHRCPTSGNNAFQNSIFSDSENDALPKVVIFDDAT